MENLFELFYPKIWLLNFSDFIFAPQKVQIFIEMLSRKVEGIDPAKP
jgi:hypothetical protein